jgi:hypothetical protein
MHTCSSSSVRDQLSTLLSFMALRTAGTADEEADGEEDDAAADATEEAREEDSEEEEEDDAEGEDAPGVTCRGEAVMPKVEKATGRVVRDHAADSAGGSAALAGPTAALRTASSCITASLI